MEIIKSPDGWHVDGRHFTTEWQAVRFTELVAEGVAPDEAAQAVRGISAAAAAMGRITSEAKAAAARRNGRKGGRPKKLA